MMKHVVILLVAVSLGCGSVTVTETPDGAMAGTSGSTGSAGAGSTGTAGADSGIEAPIKLPEPDAGPDTTAQGGAAGTILADGGTGAAGSPPDASGSAGRDAGDADSGIAGSGGRAGSGGVSGGSGGSTAGTTGTAGKDAGTLVDAIMEAAVEAPPPTGRVLGAACSTDQQCGSNLCRQGACCSTVCADPPPSGLPGHSCMSCNVPGREGSCVAAPVGSPAPPMQCFGEYPATCGQDGTCDGSGGCRLFQRGVVCGTNSSCDGQHHCNAN